MKKNTFGSIFLILLFSFFSINVYANPTLKTSKALRFGIAPFMTPMALIKRMSPLRDYLREQLNMPVNIVTARTGNEFNKRTLSGQYDFILTNPFFAIKALDSGKFNLIAIHQKKISGLFIVPENSQINSLEDLAGKKLGAPDKAGLLGKVVTPLIKNSGIDPNNLPEIIHNANHNAGISSLRVGKVDAALIVNFMESHIKESGFKIRTIDKTEPLPGMAVLVDKKSVNIETKDAVQQAIFKLSKTDKGREILKKIKMPAFVEGTIDELEPVRKYLSKQ